MISSVRFQRCFFDNCQDAEIEAYVRSFLD
ncbi:hypothetical protein [Vibrio sp. TH_r3]